ncbi:MAG: YggS family pyridoxal phosphate-dependent enzyme [Desulfovibrio sp.]|nr:YggS family pyridoxal phosphate-dependent enzyme [Desulfovibrio sp.]
MADKEELLGRYARLKDSLATACRKHGRSPEELTLVAVSKFHPASDMAILAEAGQFDFGENYVQEFLEKKSALGNFPIRWHMTGHVQSRKTPDVAGNFALVHTLDSLKLANAFEKRLRETGLEQAVLIETNIADEPQKSGIKPGDTRELVEHILKNCPRLELQGLMCLPPVFDAGEASRPWFAKLRDLRDALSADFGLSLPVLSMGMSGDYEAAIAEGATIVRIGTDIFGPRPPKKR